MGRTAKAFLLVCGSSLSINMIVYLSRIPGVSSLPHFWWLLPAMCMILLFMMFGFLVAEILN